jgi:O-antigen ligase
MIELRWLLPADDEGREELRRLQDAASKLSPPGIVEARPAAALLVLLALVRLMHSRSGATMISLGLGLACVLGSGSRGATIVAVVAVTCILAARKSRGAGALTATLPLILLLISLASIAYLAATGYPHFLLFGSEIDLTERTLIWHYALVHWAERPVLGYGFNGFWTEPDLYFEFLRQHKWVLDNYHSGFVAVLVELGIAGMILLVALTVWICSGVRRVLGPERSSSTSAYAAEAAAGFIVLFVTINLTETFLLRSTNLLQCMFSFLLFGTLADQAVRTAARHAVPTYGWVVSRPPRASGRT